MVFKMILGGMAMAIDTSIRFLSLIRSNKIYHMIHRPHNIYYAFLKEKSSNDIERKFVSYFIYTIFFIKVKSISSDDFFDIPAGQNELFCHSKVKILCKLKTKVIKLKNGLTWNSWNCPFTNLRTNDDFPTADSPNSTNLNCANLPPAPAPALFEAPPGRAACEFAILNL